MNVTYCLAGYTSSSKIDTLAALNRTITLSSSSPPLCLLHTYHTFPVTLPSSSLLSILPSPLFLLTFLFFVFIPPTVILPTPNSFSILFSPHSLLTSFDCTNHHFYKFSLYFLISRFLACILFSRWVERIYAVWIFSWNVCMNFGKSMSIRRRRLAGF